MNSYDAEMHILRRKAATRAAADAYMQHGGSEPASQRRARLTYRRALAGVGGQLISLGYRLQGEINQLAAPEQLRYEIGD
jgi:hypothetical protein